MDTRPSLEVADIIRRHGAEFLALYGASLSNEQRRTLKALGRCRTAALGGHVEACDQCGHRRPCYNSCRNRHCPKCQGSRAVAWVRREASWLLPIDYYHVVFTLPHELGPLALQNPALVYGLLMKAAAQTLREVAGDKKRLGAEVGVVAVLHTWGQTLEHHAHVHCVVSGGGLAVDAAGQREEPVRWVSCRPGFFLSVEALSSVYRRRMLSGLRQAHARGTLGCHGRLAELSAPEAFAAWLAPLADKAWVVYCKAPFAGAAGPEIVLKYLARYTYRVAFSNSRLRALDNGQVTFSYRDYRSGGRERLQRMEAVEFLRRFLQHVLPRGFVKVRHYGLLSNSGREANLALCRWLLTLLAVATASVAGLLATATEPVADRRPGCCPECGVGQMVRIADLPRPPSCATAVPVRDTS